MKTTVKEITAKDVYITVTAQHEDGREAYSQLSECMTKRQIRALLEKAETNEWHWSCVCVRVEYMNSDGNEYEAEDYLGGCSYKSRIDFIKTSGYYDDMVSECLDSINSQLATA